MTVFCGACARVSMVFGCSASIVQRLLLPLSKLGCALVCVYALELFFLSFKGFQSLSSDLAGVWPFRIHCPEAPVLRLSRLCCVTFFVYVLGLSSSPLGVPKVPLRQLVNDRFLPCLSSDLGGVWPFRIHSVASRFLSTYWGSLLLL